MEKSYKKTFTSLKRYALLRSNCYGFELFNHVYMWPDQHGGKVKKGVAIIAQSSNIAINLTMNTRSTPMLIF